EFEGVCDLLHFIIQCTRNTDPFLIILLVITHGLCLSLERTRTAFNGASYCAFFFVIASALKIVVIDPPHRFMCFRIPNEGIFETLAGDLHVLIRIGNCASLIIALALKRPTGQDRWVAAALLGEELFAFFGDILFLAWRKDLCNECDLNEFLEFVAVLKSLLFTALFASLFIKRSTDVELCNYSRFNTEEGVVELVRDDELERMQQDGLLLQQQMELQLQNPIAVVD
ncbi:hypothetical protein PFISCL1PPCAC_26912, partial [Pristionchus fissidentatus]